MINGSLQSGYWHSDSKALVGAYVCCQVKGHMQQLAVRHLANEADVHDDDEGKETDKHGWVGREVRKMATYQLLRPKPRRDGRNDGRPNEEGEITHVETFKHANLRFMPEAVQLVMTNNLPSSS